MQTQEHTVALSTARGIDIGRLERELTEMWAVESDAKDEGAAASSSGVTRACVLNLIACATAVERSGIDAVLDEVIERHPCRALILLTDREATEARLEAYVSTRCQLSSKGAKQICGEQVTIEASGPVVETVASAVAPLLIPDVPVFLWWKRLPEQESKLFKRLALMADRVVMDSASFENPYDDFVRLVQMLREQRQLMRVSDLNWERLTLWRTVAASFWEMADYRAHLNALERVVVEYQKSDDASGPVPLRVLLAVGWLASGLGWTVVASETRLENGKVSYVLRARDGRTINIEMLGVESEGEIEPKITSLLLSTKDNSAEFFVVLKPKCTKIMSGAKLGGSQHESIRVLAYEKKSEGQSLSNELDFLTRDSVYEKAADLACELIEAMRGE